MVIGMLQCYLRQEVQRGAQITWGPGATRNAASPMREAHDQQKLNKLKS